MGTAKSASDKGASSDTKLVIVAIVAAIALIVYFFFMGNRYLAPPQSHYAQSLATAHVSTPSWLTADAKQSGGDYSKLSPTEQQKILSMCKGNPHDAANSVAMAYAASQ